MIDQEEILHIKEYLKKLQKVITYEYDFSLMNNKLIKKNKIDDTFVCLLSVLPQSFKRALNVKNFEKVPSVVFYKKMFNSIKGKFILNNNVYSVNYNDAIDSICRLLENIEKDLNQIEQQSL